MVKSPNLTITHVRKEQPQPPSWAADESSHRILRNPRLQYGYVQTQFPTANRNAVGLSQTLLKPSRVYRFSAVVVLVAENMHLADGEGTL
jgi:hypothetical protein